MIEIKNLTKIYKTKQKNNVVAIDDISLNLPDKGMVFIVGKSGSGKSTLLNMIGGLDKCTKGEIIADGNVITKMRKSALTKYRNQYLGFIFQDYHVLDRLTVKQNIELSLDLNNQKNDEIVDKIIHKVDLVGYENRYPSELSGGQKQRISVARALVKDATVILCDEPTGNLDKKTTTQILEILKKISKEKLVLIVSHSIVDANKYGDRIIELYDGKVFRDRQRNDIYVNEFKIEDNVVYLPHYNDLIPNELIQINEAIEKNDNLVFKQIGNKFYESEKVTDKHRNIVLSKIKVNHDGSKKMYKMFFKKKASLIFNILVISLLLVCFAIFQSFLNFNSNKELSKSLTSHNITTVPLQKGTLNTSDHLSISSLKRVDDEDIKSFIDAGYDDPIYTKYNNTLPIVQMKVDAEQGISISTTFGYLYCTETLGTINCDEKMLTDMYGVIEFLEKAPEYKEYGVYITDYVADSIKNFKPTESSYSDIVGVFEYNKTNYGYINGIIKTNYRERYKYIFDELEKSKEDNNIGELINKIKDTKEYSDFLIEAINFLAYGYSFEEDYSESIKNLEFRNFLRISDFDVRINNGNNTFVEESKIFSHNKTLNEGEVLLSMNTFNNIFGTNYTDTNEFEPCDFEIIFYKNNLRANGIEYQKTFKVVGLTKTTLNYINVEYAAELREFDVIKYGIYLSNHDDINEMIKVATDRNFVISSADATKLSTINRVLEIFGKFFTFIELFFLLVTIIFIINTGRSTVKKNKYEIGVLKALGVSNYSITKQFLKQSIILCILICAVSNIGIYFGTMLGNAVLTKAFEIVLETEFFDLKLISYMPELVVMDLIYIAAIAIISFIIPQVMLMRIRPIEIIRARE